MVRRSPGDRWRLEAPLWRLRNRRDEVGELARAWRANVEEGRPADRAEECLRAAFEARYGDAE